MNPHFKIEVGSSTFIDEEAFNIQVSRAENNVSYAVVSVGDYKSKNFVDVFDALGNKTIYFYYGNDTPTKVFGGTISTVAPKLSDQGEVLEVGAWGKGWALARTHCNTSYGLESQNTAKKTPKEIWDDIIENYVKLSFADSGTGYDDFTTTKIADIHNDLSITNLTSPYLDNFTMINRVCDLVTAHVGSGVASCHWFVDPDSNLFINTIGNHENNASGWPTYWKGSQAASTIQVADNMILYDFRKNIEEFANKIVLCSTLRKPGYDYWTENQSGLWGKTNITLTDDDATYIVGKYSLKLEPTVSNGSDVAARYPSANAAWDLTKIGSQDTPARLNFQFRINSDLGTALYLGLHTDSTNYYYMNLYPIIGTSVNKWFYFSTPIGPHWKVNAENKLLEWVQNNSPNWNNINYIQLLWASTSTATDIWLDDLHFSGKVIREAYDSDNISTNTEYQRVMRNDTAVDDSMKATDTGTAAALAKAELLRRMQIPTVGTIQIPGAEDMLPGQLVHIHACKKSDGTYRIDNKDFRIKELKHIFAGPPIGFRTTLNLTDDLYTTQAIGAPDLYSLLKEYAGALGHAEARDLKGSGIDILIPRLSKDYA